jgi:hypothetical protein
MSHELARPVVCAKLRHGLPNCRRARVPRWQGIDVDAVAQEVDGKFMSAFIRAVKPTHPSVEDDEE